VVKTRVKVLRSQLAINLAILGMDAISTPIPLISVFLADF
jgi:hypothetical protein